MEKREGCVRCSCCCCCPGGRTAGFPSVFTIRKKKEKEASAGSGGGGGEGLHPIQKQSEKEATEDKTMVHDVRSSGDAKEKMRRETKTALYIYIQGTHTHLHTHVYMRQLTCLPKNARTHQIHDPYCRLVNDTTAQLTKKKAKQHHRKRAGKKRQRKRRNNHVSLYMRRTEEHAQSPFDRAPIVVLHW